MIFGYENCIKSYLLDKERRNDGVTARPDVFPAPLDISDLVGSQFGLGISQIFGFPRRK